MTKTFQAILNSVVVWSVNLFKRFLNQFRSCFFNSKLENFEEYDFVLFNDFSLSSLFKEVKRPNNQDIIPMLKNINVQTFTTGNKVCSVTFFYRGHVNSITAIVNGKFLFIRGTRLTGYYIISHRRFFLTNFII